jgi:diguanylate cyclase (GGDEF)-like protein
MGLKRSPSASVGVSDLTSLEERLGLLLIVRLGLIAMVVLGALVASAQVGFHIGNVGPISVAYLTVAVGAEAFRRTRRRGSMLLHRAVLPLDSVYLAMVTTPSGGPRSQLVVLFAVQLIAVTLLASQRTGVRVALWDTFLFVVIPTLSLSGRMATFLGLRVVAAPPASQTALAIMGFWVVALCTAFFSSVSERELRRHKAELESLAAMAANLERGPDEEESFSVLLSTVVATFPFRRGIVWWTRGDTRHGLVLDARSDGTVQAVAVDARAHLDRVATEVRGSREPRLLKRLDSTRDPVADALLPGARNVVALPLELEGGDRGLLLLEHGGHPLDARLPRRTLVMLGEFSIHAVLSVSNSRLLAERERLATIDGLTGLANRREFDQVLTREVNRSARSGEPLSLVVVDVDHFKRINDTRGHLAGDEVLRALAAVLSTAMREMDLVARYGGEEFAVVLPRCDQIDAVRVIRRFTSLMRRCPELEGVTVSSGVATMPDNVSGAEELISAADEALYESKRAGRDRYTISSRATKRRSLDLLERS